MRKMNWRYLQAAFLCVAMVVMLGAGGSDPDRQFNRLGHEMICMCGCGQILLECNHVGCPVSPGMIAELHGQIASGAGDTAVLNWFAAKYGAIVLAAPIRGGFDDVAWIAPIAVFVLATAGTAVLVWMWRRRSLRITGAADACSVLDYHPASNPGKEDTAMRERIRRETEYR